MIYNLFKTNLPTNYWLMNHIYIIRIRHITYKRGRDMEYIQKHTEFVNIGLFKNYYFTPWEIFFTAIADGLSLEFVDKYPQIFITLINNTVICIGCNCLGLFLWRVPFGSTSFFLWSLVRIRVLLVGNCLFRAHVFREWRWIFWTRIHVFHLEL